MSKSSSSLPAGSCFVNSAKCASQLRHRTSHVNCPRFPKYHARGASIKPYVAFQDMQQLPQAYVGKLSNSLKKSSPRALPCTDLASGIPDRNAALTSDVSSDMAKLAPSVTATCTETQDVVGASIRYVPIRGSTCPKDYDAAPSILLRGSYIPHWHSYD